MLLSCDGDGPGRAGRIDRDAQATTVNDTVMIDSSKPSRNGLLRSSYDRENVGP
jgi:hypothetical protein